MTKFSLQNKIPRLDLMLSGLAKLLAEVQSAFLTLYCVRASFFLLTLCCLSFADFNDVLFGDLVGSPSDSASLTFSACVN